MYIINQITFVKSGVKCFKHYIDKLITFNIDWKKIGKNWKY